jgi:hypothetical protein
MVQLAMVITKEYNYIKLSHLFMLLDENPLMTNYVPYHVLLQLRIPRHRGIHLGIQAMDRLSQLCHHLLGRASLEGL